MGKMLNDAEGGRLSSNHQGLHYPRNIADYGEGGALGGN